jgi:hypothetical protein
MPRYDPANGVRQRPDCDSDDDDDDDQKHQTDEAAVYEHQVLHISEAAASGVG